MERGNEWSVRVTRGVGQRVAYYRNRADLTASMLSARCAELGLPVDRNVVAKLENGHRNSVTVDEVYVLAAALEVPPLLLLFGVGTEETAEILPGNHVPAFWAARWFSGEGAMRFLPGGGNVLLSGPWDSGPGRFLALYRSHDHVAGEEMRATTRAAEMDKRAASAGTDAEREGFTLAAGAERRLAEACRLSAGRLREEAEALGIHPPVAMTGGRDPQAAGIAGEQRPAEDKGTTR